jgi:1,4-dihydroxy-2-naphthoyl-CoA hydrolase
MSDLPVNEAARTMAAVGLDATLGLSLVHASDQEVVAELTVGPQHYQPMGIVHGGVYCTMVETACSVGAMFAASKYGRTIVGTDNSTSFLKATRTGTLRCTARLLSGGKRTQLWEARITDEAGALVATGRLRVLCLEPDKDLAGKPAGALTRGAP